MTRGRTLSTRSILSEALRDVRSGTTGALLLGVLWSLLAGGLVWADTAVTASIVHDAREFRTAGGSVLVLDAPGRIDGAACERLGRIPGVRAAGALVRSAVELTPLTTPGVALPGVDATPGLVEVLLPDVQGARGVIVSEDVATALALSAGTELPTTRGGVEVTAVFPYPDDGRRADLAYAALQIVVASGRFDQCWVDARPPTTSVRTVLGLVLRPGGADAPAPVTAQLNPTLGVDFDGERLVRARPTAAAPLVLLIVGAVVGHLATRRRRLELASHRLAGVGTGAQIAQLGLETVVWSVPSIGVALAAAAAVGGTADLDASSTALAPALTAGVAGVIGTVLGCGAAIGTVDPGRIAGYARDR